MGPEWGHRVYTTRFCYTRKKKEGEAIQFNEPAYKGQMDLVSAHETKRMLNDFPDRIKGSVIEQKALLNIIRLLFEKLEADYNSLSEKDEYTKVRFEEFKNYFDSELKRNEMLKGFLEFPNLLKHLALNLDNSDQVNDIANKYFNLQRIVREEQMRNKEIGSMTSENYSRK